MRPSATFSGWTLARRLRVALLSVVVILAIALASVIVALRKADDLFADQTQRILVARVAAKELLTSLVDQETGLRGYALTRGETFLDPYRQGVEKEKKVRADLGRYIDAEDPAHLALLSVDAAVTAWQDEYAALRLQDVLRGSTLTTIDFGRELFDRVRQTNADLDIALAKEAAQAQHDANDQRHLVVVVLAAMTALGALGLIGLQWALRSMVLRPLRGLGEQVDVVSRGTHDFSIEAEGPPDIRAMGIGVEAMRQELVRALASVEEQQRDIERRATELARSNADLEQFAYVASHDLQEPLRKVASFCQLLEQRYSGQLDERGEQYLAFAVDGAKRMQQLISDLLTFSRVGRTSEGFVPIDLNETITRSWTIIESRVQDAGAEIEVSVHDRVLGDTSLLQMLMSNLLGNAVKYARPGVAPRVRISSVREGDLLRIDVADNGIGIPPEFESKVFVIFQRLHGRDEYEGTGIGLALCKKIVEFHGGTIGLRTSPLGGAAVSFTLPVSTDAHA